MGGASVLMLKCCRQTKLPQVWTAENAPATWATPPSGFPPLCVLHSHWLSFFRSRKHICNTCCPNGVQQVVTHRRFTSNLIRALKTRAEVEMCEQGISLCFQNLTAARRALKICALEFTLACKICPDSQT